MRQGSCEVWVAELPELAAHHAALDAVLTGDERAYLADRRRGAAAATASRAILRLLLARYLDRPPAEVVVDRTCPTCGRPHGKPRLPTEGGGAPPLQFSVSHGGDLLLVAFVGVGSVGVDVEPLEAGREVPDALVALALTPLEQQHLESLPPDRRGELFLRYWAGKEAVLKAIGTGLDAAPQTVTLAEPDLSRATALTPADPVPVPFRLRPLDLGAGHVGVLATEREVDDLRLRRWSPTLLENSPC